MATKTLYLKCGAERNPFGRTFTFVLLFVMVASCRSVTFLRAAKTPTSDTSIGSSDHTLSSLLRSGDPEIQNNSVASTSAFALSAAAPAVQLGSRTSRISATRGKRVKRGASLVCQVRIRATTYPTLLPRCFYPSSGELPRFGLLRVPKRHQDFPRRGIPHANSCATPEDYPFRGSWCAFFERYFKAACFFVPGLESLADCVSLSCIGSVTGVSPRSGALLNDSVSHLLFTCGFFLFVLFLGSIGAASG